MQSEPSPSEVAKEVARVLGTYRFRYTDEVDLQLGVEAALQESGVPFSRELSLDERSRIDFLVHAHWKIGVEVKINGSSSEVDRQLRRYLKHPLIDGLVLVTTRRRHRALAAHLEPLEVVWLGSSAF